MNEITLFQNESFGSLRTVMQDGEPWFVAADVCKALEIGNSRQALTRLDADEKGVISTDTPGGKQDMATVSESGLYSLILGSRKPEARQFKRWITHDVIPSIRQTGAYTAPNALSRILADPDNAIRFLQQLSAERTARIAAQDAQSSTAIQLASAQQQLSDIRSALTNVSAAFVTEQDADRSNCVTLSDFARQMSIPRNKLFSWLRDTGYISTTSPLPTPMAIQSGYLCIVEKHSGTTPYYVAGITLVGRLMFNSKHTF